MTKERTMHQSSEKMSARKVYLILLFMTALMLVATKTLIY
jgi:hypothetical protein